MIKVFRILFFISVNYCLINIIIDTTYNFSITYLIVSILEKNWMKKSFWYLTTKKKRVCRLTWNPNYFHKKVYRLIIKKGNDLLYRLSRKRCIKVAVRHPWWKTKSKTLIAFCSLNSPTNISYQDEP